MIEARQLKELSQAESLRLLGSVPFGRVVFTYRALPAIRPVNHIVVGDSIIIRASLGTAISSEVGSDGGTVVAYEADAIDSSTGLGWSVVVIGRARQVLDHAEVARHRRKLHPWVTGEVDEVIAIHAGLVSGYRLVTAATPRAAG